MNKFKTKASEIYYGLWLRFDNARLRRFARSKKYRQAVADAEAAGIVGIECGVDDIQLTYDHGTKILPMSWYDK